ncbi:MAG: hypothetical protein JWP97_2500 [Labilithrix sp.]|nr:hypothetical protein [Labilithrix sp.]
MGVPRTKVAFFCREDFANVSTEIAHALREHTGTHEGRVIALGAHAFGYARPHDLDLNTASPDGLRAGMAFLEEASTVVWAEEATEFGDMFSAYGTQNLLASLLASCAKKRRVVFHAGGAYRAGAARYNPLDAEAFDGQLCSPDLLRLALPRARCVWAKPMTTDLEAVDRLWKARRAAGKIVVTHSPSSHAGKGTALVRRVMARVEQACPNVEYREIGGPFGQHLPHGALMGMRDAGVLHIDQYHTGIGGIGVASFEAMTRGIIPLASTNRIGDAAYKQWGFDRASFPLVPLAFDKQEKANEKQTERALVHILTQLGKTPLERLEARGRAAAAWAHDNLSPAAFARTWIKQLDHVCGVSTAASGRAA